MRILKSPKLIGRLIFFGMKVLMSTVKLTVNRSAEIDPNKPYLFAFWHGEQFLPAQIAVTHHNTPKCIMVSPSRDGAILAELLQKVGYEILRGSSRDGNVRALINMKNKLEAGYSIGFGIDGPIGPIYQVKPGIAFLAQKCNVQIIPLGSASTRYWIFEKAWDKFKLPKPFSKSAIFFGTPFEIKASDNIEDACLKIAKMVNDAQQKATAML